MKTSKTAAGATLGLYVAIVGLVAAVLTLLGAAVRLAATGLQALTVRLLPAAAPVVAPAAAPVVAAPASAPARPNLRLVPAPSVEPLTTALIGLGFKPAEVRRFVATLGPRAGTESLAEDIKAGLRFLA